MRKVQVVLGIVCWFAGLSAYAQTTSAWDDTSKNYWPSSFQQVIIPASADGSQQKAYFFRTTGKTPQPLIISLHTWSGDFRQSDPLTNEILARDWNYIHPDFRDPNRMPQSMGSPFVISDIKDAIEFAVKHGNVDTEEIHIIGVSGGGYATLCSYMQLDYPVKSFSAWASISDLEAWYWESTTRNQNYAKNILSALGGSFDIAEARRRSPLYQLPPQSKRKNASLYLYAGIHDGYKGSVPITHSIRMYNRLVSDIKKQTTRMIDNDDISEPDSDIVSDSLIIELLTKRVLPLAGEKLETLYDRKVYLKKQVENIHLTIFEGRHEQLPQALSLIPVNGEKKQGYHTLTIGDSNGEIPGGWVFWTSMQRMVCTCVLTDRELWQIGLLHR